MHTDGKEENLQRNGQMDNLERIAKTSITWWAVQDRLTPTLGKAGFSALKLG